MTKKISNEQEQIDQQKKILEDAKANVEPNLPKKEMAEIETAEQDLTENEYTLEIQIEKYREIVNNIMILADKVRESNGGKVSNILEGKFRQAYGLLHTLTSDWSTENKRDGYKVLIERCNVDAKGFLVVDAGGREAADAMAADLREAVLRLMSDGVDSIISVTSGLSEDTRHAEIKVSTVAGFAVQRYDVYPEYKVAKELFPLDNIPKSSGLGQNEGPLSLVK